MQMKKNSSSCMDSMLALDIIHVANGEEVCTLWHSVVNVWNLANEHFIMVFCQLCKKVGFFHNKNVHMIDSILNLFRLIFQLEKKVAKTLLYFKLLI